MKIAINGSVVDTEHIWKINPIKDSYHSTSTALEFTIDFFQGKSLVVELDSKEVFDGTDVNWWEKSKVEEIRNKLNLLRDSIISVWSENQSKIPQFSTGTSFEKPEPFRYPDGYDPEG